jgi:hypothetical protein
MSLPRRFSRSSPDITNPKKNKYKKQKSHAFLFCNPTNQVEIIIPATPKKKKNLKSQRR